MAFWKERDLGILKTALNIATLADVPCFECAVYFAAMAHVVLHMQVSHTRQTAETWISNII